MKRADRDYKELLRFLAILNLLINQLQSTMIELSSLRSALKDQLLNDTSRIRDRYVVEEKDFILEIIPHGKSMDLKVAFKDTEESPVTIPDLNVPDNILKAMRAGWLAAGSLVMYEPTPRIRTYKIWQLISWTTLFPGRVVYLSAGEFLITDYDIKIGWSARINDRIDEWYNREDAIKYIEGLSNGEFFLYSR